MMLPHAAALLIVLPLVWVPQLFAAAYEWSSHAGEAGFRVEIPEGWRIWESRRRNGVIVQFRRGNARIEVRSMAAKEGFNTQQVLNQKSARLSADYPMVKYLGERPSRHAAELTLNMWEIHSKGKKYLEESAIYLAPEGPVVVSCFIRHEEVEKYRTECENAYYSLNLGAGEPKEKSATSDLAKELQNLHFLHVPNNLPVIEPETVLEGTVPSKSKPQIQYDENYILPAEEYR